MKSKLLQLRKVLLVAAGLLVGASTWAYEVPSGYEIKNVFIGTDNGNGTVTAEDFESVTAVPAGWTYDVNSISIAEITEVPKVAVGSVVPDYPTYVGGNTFKAYLRQGSSNGQRNATYTFGEISTGKLIFSADFFADGTVTSSGIYLQFLDADDNLVLTLRPKEYSNNQGNFGYAVGDGDITDIGSTNTLWRTYVGYGIQDLVIDFATGETSFTLDFTERSGSPATWHRTQRNVNINIGENKKIAKFRIGKMSASSSDVNFYIDNIQLYTIGLESAANSYKIKATANEGTLDLGTIAEGYCKGGVSYGATGLAKVIEKDGAYYVLDDESVKDFSVSYTMGDSDEERNVNYKKDDNIIFFIEGETQGQKTESATCSGGAYSNYYANPVSFPVSEAGTYELETNVASRNNNSSLEVYTSASTVSVAQIAKNGPLGIRTCNFIAAAGSTMRVGGPYYSEKFQNSLGVDYILIRKVSDTATLPKTITSAGYATYCSPYALDFSSVDGLTAYIATVDESIATFSPVKSVPANTGVLLKGNADTYDIPVVGSSDTDVKTNKFVGVIEKTTVDAGIYVLMSGDNGVGFYKTVNAFTVGANTAYLPADVAEGRMFIGLDNETTGINEAVVNGAQTGTYNLNGQRVAQPTKGLYIVNGKKVIIK